MSAHTLPGPTTQRRARSRYRAFRDPAGRAVVLRDVAPGASVSEVLEASAQIDWGRPCAGSRRLAWLLLYDASGSRLLADDWADGFAEEIVERLPGPGFVLARDDVVGWLDSSPD